MAELEDLTTEQTDKLVQYQAVTGIEEIDECRTWLEQHDWNLEMAVNARITDQEGTSAFRESEGLPRTPPVNANHNSSRVYSVVSRRPHGVTGWGYYLIMFPFKFVYSTLMDLVRFAYRLFRPDPRRYVLNPKDDVLSFIRKFKEAYGQNHPDFYRGTYSQSLKEAKQELKFLLVYLHSDDHQDTPQFCRNTLCDEAVIRFINSELIFWACNTNSPEGHRVSQALKETTYPFLALIVLQRNVMTVVGRMEGNIEPVELINRVRRIMTDNEGSLIAERLDREERIMTRNLRDQQDVAYRESLRADQEKDRRKREEHEAKEEDERAARALEAERLLTLEDIARQKERIRDTIPQEPDLDDPDAITVVIKLQNGTRLVRRFLRTDSLKHLYNFVFVNESTPKDFQIVSNFPIKVLDCKPTDTMPEPLSFEAAGLEKSSTLFVRDTET